MYLMMILAKRRQKTVLTMLFLQYILKINHQVKYHPSKLHMLDISIKVAGLVFDRFLPTSLLIRLDTVFKISKYNILKKFCQLF